MPIVNCPTCRGEGSIKNGHRCRICKGTGEIVVDISEMKKRKRKDKVR